MELHLQSQDSLKLVAHHAEHTFSNLLQHYILHSKYDQCEVKFCGKSDVDEDTDRIEILVQVEWNEEWFKKSNTCSNVHVRDYDSIVTDSLHLQLQDHNDPYNRFVEFFTEVLNRIIAFYKKIDELYSNEIKRIEK